jgi:uncharacterized membrane protein affecting hemolysin expression
MTKRKKEKHRVTQRFTIFSRTLWISLTLGVILCNILKHRIKHQFTFQFEIKIQKISQLFNESKSGTNTLNI